jgi:hypothetical protein
LTAVFLKDDLLTEKDALVSLEDVCYELKKYGLDFDARKLRETYASEEKLAEVERNLWKMLRSIEEESNRRG